MTTSATLMVRTCHCATRTTCTCSSQPLNPAGGVRSVRASSVETNLDRARVGRRLTQPSPADIAKTRHLLRAMQRAAITPPGAGEPLTTAQFTDLLAGKTISERISLRMLCKQAGLTPSGGV
jgi:hypothetical protein